MMDLTTMSSVLVPTAHPSWITRRVDKVCAVVVVCSPNWSRDHGTRLLSFGTMSCVSTSMAAMRSHGTSLSKTHFGGGFVHMISVPDAVRSLTFQTLRA